MTLKFENPFFGSETGFLKRKLHRITSHWFWLERNKDYIFGTISSCLADNKNIKGVLVGGLTRKVTLACRNVLFLFGRVAPTQNVVKVGLSKVLMDSFSLLPCLATNQKESMMKLRKRLGQKPKRKQKAIKFKESLWTPVTCGMTLDTRLTDTDRRAFNVIHLLSLKAGYCFASNETLGATLKIHPMSISKAVSRLIEYGYIYVRVFSDVIRYGRKKTERRIFISNPNSISRQRIILTTQSYPRSFL